MAPKTAAINEQIAKVRKLADAAESLTSSKLTENERGKARKAESRLLAKIVEIPQLSAEDRAFREELEKDDEEWLWFFFSKDSGTRKPFWYRFTRQQKKMIREIGQVIKYRFDKAIAAARGEGKSTYCIRTILKHVLTGAVNFAVLCAATGPLASSMLETMRSEIETNNLLLRYYPEVCVPVRELKNVAQNARTQVVSGYRHDNGERFEKVGSSFHWCGNEVEFPCVPGSPSAGAMIITRGLDGAIRGLNRKGRRPQVIVIDDPDTADTVANVDLARKLEITIDLTLGGLGDQDSPVGRIMITTIQRPDCVSAWYTDPKRKPWMGERFRSMLSPPIDKAKWDHFVDLWREDKTMVGTDGEFLDPHCRRSHAYYLANQDEMDAGHDMANPYRYNTTPLEDGTTTEATAIEAYYVAIAKNGLLYAQCELDNDPPPETGARESGISIGLVQRKVSGFARYVIPPDCDFLTFAGDVGKHYIHWVVRAWRMDGGGFYTIDYGSPQVPGTERNVNSGVDVLIRKAILQIAEEIDDKGYMNPDGEILSPKIGIIDSRYYKDAVWRACKDFKGDFPLRPSMGHGKSHGCQTGSYHRVVKNGGGKKRGGEFWHEARERIDGSPIWVIHYDADYWKRWEVNRWLTEAGSKGSMYLWGQPSKDPKSMSADERDHRKYAEQICGEVEIEEDGQSTWDYRGANHWLDASAYSCIGAASQGLNLLAATSEKPQPERRLSQPAPPPSPDERFQGRVRQMRIRRR